jgi:hypothetical protein
LVGKLEERHLGDLGVNGKEKIKTDLKKIGCNDVDQIHPVHDRVQWRGSCENGNEPLGFVKGGEFLYYLSDY